MALPSFIYIPILEPEPKSEKNLKKREKFMRWQYPHPRWVEGAGEPSGDGSAQRSLRPYIPHPRWVEGSGGLAELSPLGGGKSGSDSGVRKLGYKACVFILIFGRNKVQGCRPVIVRLRRT